MALIPANLILPRSHGIGIKYTTRDTYFTDRFKAVVRNGISFDLIMEETHIWENDVATHTVEDGSTITDHIRNNPREGRLVGMISDYSLRSFIGANFDSRSENAYVALKSIWQKRQLVDIVIVMEVYKNVAITSVNIRKDSQSTSHQIFEIGFKEVQIKKTESVQTSFKVNGGEMNTDISKQVAPDLAMSRQVGDYSTGVSLIG